MSIYQCFQMYWSYRIKTRTRPDFKIKKWGKKNGSDGCSRKYIEEERELYNNYSRED